MSTPATSATVASTATPAISHTRRALLIAIREITRSTSVSIDQRELDRQPTIGRDALPE
jgi:hypothetical protein